MKKIGETNEYLRKFGLSHGQFFAHYKYKNLWWHLNGVEIGYGDLREEDIERIQENLVPGDEFCGFHEMHGTEWAPRDGLPMVIINHNGVVHNADVVRYIEEQS